MCNCCVSVDFSVLGLQGLSAEPAAVQDFPISLAASRAWLLPPCHLLAASFSPVASASSSPAVITLTAQLTAPQLAFLGDCRMQGRPLMPASAWAEMMAAACSVLASNDIFDGALVLADAVVGSALDLQATAATRRSVQTQLHLAAGRAEVTSTTASSAAALDRHLSVRLRLACPASSAQPATVAGRHIHLRVRAQVLGAFATTVAVAASSLAAVLVPNDQLDATGFVVHPGTAEAVTSLAALPEAAGSADPMPHGLPTQWDACVSWARTVTHMNGGGCSMQVSRIEHPHGLTAFAITVCPHFSVERSCACRCLAQRRQYCGHDSSVVSCCAELRAAHMDHGRPAAAASWLAGLSQDVRWCPTTASRA